MQRFLLDTTLPGWVTTTVPIVRYVFLGTMVVCALFIIVAVLGQTSDNDSGNVITGQSESYYSQNRASNTSGRLSKWTVISIITIGVLSVLYFLSFLIFAGV